MCARSSGTPAASLSTMAKKSPPKAMSTGTRLVPRCTALPAVWTKAGPASTKTVVTPPAGRTRVRTRPMGVSKTS